MKEHRDAWLMFAIVVSLVFLTLVIAFYKEATK